MKLADARMRGTTPSLALRLAYKAADFLVLDNLKRSIGLHPGLFFDPDPLYLPCTLIHEIAHIGGATSDTEAPRAQAHAAEATLPPCNCRDQAWLLSQ